MLVTMRAREGPELLYYYCQTCKRELAPSRVAAQVHAQEGCEVVDMKEGLPIGGEDPCWKLRDFTLADGSLMYDVISTDGRIAFYPTDEDHARELLRVIHGCAAVRVLA